MPNTLLALAEAAEGPRDEMQADANNLQNMLTKFKNARTLERLKAEIDDVNQKALSLEQFSDMVRQAREFAPPILPIYPLGPVES